MPTSLLRESTSQLTWVIVDANIDDYQAIADGVLETAIPFVLNRDRDGILQITELIQAAQIKPQALHIVSHGAPGTLYLGQGELSLDTLDSYASHLNSWGVQTLSLYGCQVAAGDAGEAFITRLHALTKAQIAASTTPIGNAALGGNWHLDKTTHSQVARPAIEPSVLSSYAGTLAPLPEVSALFNLNGEAAETAINEISLVQDGDLNASGSAFSRARIDFRQDWTFTFDVFLGDKDNDGADGIGFVLHNDPAGSGVIGIDGRGLGVAGIDNSIVIEFDTFQNDGIGDFFADPIEDHVAFILDSETGRLDHDNLPENAAQILPNIEDDVPHRVVVDWTASSNTLSYSFDGTTTDSITRDVIDLDFGDGELIFWGFGAATGSLTNEHRVTLVDFNGRLVDEDEDEDFDPDNLEPVKISSGPIVFQFDDFVRFERLDEGRSYQGFRADFHEETYLLAHPDVAAAVRQGAFTSGFQHYQLFGRNEGRDLLPLDLEMGGIRLSALFDETFYLDQNADVDAVLRSGDMAYGYEHFVQFGLREGRNPSLYYNEDFYLSNNGDVANAVQAGSFDSGLEHYLLFGHIENRQASILFDPDDYLTSNPDVVDGVNNGAFSSGFDHYLEFGASEGRVSTLLFEESFYLARNPDVAAAVQAGGFGTGFDHYIIFGQREGRDSSPLFDESSYLDCNPRVAEAISSGGFSSGMEHFFRFGRQEGRIAEAV